MNEAILNYLSHLYGYVVLIVVATAALIFAMATDLIFGVRKAKLRGEAATSKGFKKTCEKARKYYSPFIELVCIDLIGCVIIHVPAFSMLWAAYCVCCEFTSVREKAWKKAELRKQERTMSIILENKDDIAKMIAELIKKQADGNA